MSVTMWAVVIMGAALLGLAILAGVSLAMRERDEEDR